MHKNCLANFPLHSLSRAFSFRCFIATCKLAALNDVNNKMSEETNNNSFLAEPEQSNKSSKHLPSDKDQEEIIQSPIVNSPEKEFYEIADVIEKNLDDIPTDQIISSPSDVHNVVESFENMQPIYGSESLSLQGDNEIAEDGDEEKKKLLEEIKNYTKENLEKSDKSEVKEEKGKKDSIQYREKKEKSEGKRERRKSSVLTENQSQSGRKVSDAYKIEIPLKKKVTKSTRKKLWREIQKRKPFITENVAAHIQHFAKPPFITWGCNNCAYQHESRTYFYESRNR